MSALPAQDTANGATRLGYLEDMAQTRGRARILRAEDLEDGRARLVLDQTLFYPQGGGQPFDQGAILSPQASFQVEEVRMAGGEVHHIGRYQSGRLAPGEEVDLEVDAVRRLLNSRCHTAGELICAAVRSLGHSDWFVVGAIHHPDHSSIDYDVVLEPEAQQRLAADVEREVNRLANLGGAVQARVVASREEVRRLCGFDPDYVPASEPVRVVTVAGDLGRPCQGTHVRDLHEVGPVRILKVKSKKGKTTISYALQGGAP